jgi:hypothetical protein
MLVLSTIHRKSFGYIYIWTGIMSILDGEKKEKNIHKRITLRKKKKNE